MRNMDGIKIKITSMIKIMIKIMIKTQTLKHLHRVIKGIGILLFLYCCAFTAYEKTRFFYFIEAVSAQDEQGVIKGTIIDKSTDKVISDSIIILEQEDKEIDSFISLDDGSFMFLDLQAGDYIIKASKRGFTDNSKMTNIDNNIIIKNVELIPIQINSSTIQNPRLTGVQTGVFSDLHVPFGFVDGKVFDGSKGTVVPDAVVSLSQSDKIVLSETTEENGAYFIETLPGNYDIVVSADNFEKYKQEISINAFERLTQDIELFPLTGTPEPGTSPTPEPSTSPTPEPSTSPTPTPAVECNDGGIPVRMRISRKLIVLSPNEMRGVKIKMWKKKEDGLRPIEGCSIDVNVECIKGCEGLIISDETVLTNKRGIGSLSIKSISHESGNANVKISAGGLESYVNIILKSR